LWSASSPHSLNRRVNKDYEMFTVAIEAFNYAMMERLRVRRLAVRRLL
jgi:hypothetical protein